MMEGVFVDYGQTFYPTPGLEDEEVAAILHEITVSRLFTQVPEVGASLGIL